MKLFSILLSIATLLFACSTKPFNESMAAELCQCMQPLASLYQELKTLDRDTLRRRMSTLEAAIEHITAESNRCVTRLEEKYGTLSPARELKLQQTMRGICPDIVALVQEAGSPETQ